MELHAILVTTFGGVVLLTAWLPMLMREMPLSLPIVCIVIGYLLVSSPLGPALQANPLENRHFTERLTEFLVVVSLVGAGLKIDRPFSWRAWRATWRLLGIAMPLSIAAGCLVGWGILGLALPSALLLGAALAPTDPVLAADVQVGPPGTGDEDEMRFALTSEAGLNDGLAFPFVFLAIALAAAPSLTDAPILEWALVDVVWKLAAGLAVGWLTGKLIGWLTFRLPQRTRLSRTGDGIVALGIASLGYGLTEMAHGYGFLAVFVAAVAMRGVERGSHYHAQLHTFAEQVERLFMMILLVCFGAAIAEGSILAALDWRVLLAAALLLFAIRPLSGWISLLGCDLPAPQKAVISFYGIRGIGSFYYVAFALGQAEFADTRIIWVTVSTVVLVSIVFHGMTVTPVMRRVEAQAEPAGGA